MSYCRTGEDSDVYVYPSGQGIVCCQCPMIGEDLVKPDALNMLTHLLGHIARDEKVPRAALDRLMGEAGLLSLSNVIQAHKRLPWEIQAVLARLEALPPQWLERAHSADERDAVLIDLHKAVREWDTK